MKKAASCCPLQAFPCHICMHQLKMYRKHNNHLLWIVTVAGMKAVMGWFADDGESKSCKPHAIPCINLACSWQAQGEVSQLKPQVQDRLSIKERIRRFLFQGQVYADPAWPCFKWTSSLHIQDMTYMPTLCNAPYLYQIHRLWVWAQGCSRLPDLLKRSFRKHWFYHVLRSVGQILWNDHAKVCVQLRKSPPLWGCLACNVQVLGIPWSHLHKILHTKNESYRSYMYLVIVPWADGLTHINQSTKRVRGLVWENDTGICGRNVDTGQNKIKGHSHMGLIIINNPKHLRSGVLDQEYCLPELSKWHHLLTLAARRGSLDACRLLDCVLHWALWLPHIPCAMGCFERLHLKPPHSFRACPRVCGKETHKQIASSNSELWLTRLIEQLPKNHIESDIYKNHETSCNM